MQTSTATAPTPRRATRSIDDRMLGGVAAGLAAHLGVEVRWVRVGFVAATFVGGLGPVLYAVLWLVLPADAHLEADAPGLESASRLGKRRPRRAGRLEDIGPLVALGAVAVGVVVLAQSLVGGATFFWPLLVGALGLAVLWRQADEAQRERWLDSTGRIDLRRAVVGRGGVASYSRLVAGLAMLVAAFVLFAVQTGQAGVAGDLLAAGLLGVLGIALTVGPWVFRLVGDLSEERAARVRSQERADVAAHLHDSVLQTLALIQKHAGDGRTVATLARAQERDLRAWLYADAPSAHESLAGALKAAAAEVEDTHGVPVEVVTVGDAPAGDRTRALVLAAREAMVNAAKHSKADKIDVFAERVGDRVDVFVRDRGTGFDPAAVPDDRLGLRNSVVDRMQRHGGTAQVRTAPGEGTEVRLSIQAAGEES